MGVEGEWATKKADAVVGSLGHSKMEEESNHKHFSFLFTCCKQQPGIQIQEKNFLLYFCLLGFFVCLVFLTGSVKPGTTHDCIPLNGQEPFGV